ncbi:hypothetical protein D0812_24715 [Vibrio owensii]|uniref:Lipoprotein n=1 Tax=Vibrio owensii TaxID=696485 RepID=A0AAP9GGC6_9VIBR|nr:hypothetical protein [Vibrio owensii]AYO17561.1 hypothetical protein D0812_24715 [Vibrio owensii]QGH49668.1 hypothetical protein APZ19_21480 [Vibrio owensii]
MKALITIIMGLALTACGGGGGGGGGGNITPPPTQTTVPEEDTTQQEETTEEETTVTVEEDATMQDLVVPDDFSYNPVTEGTLNVDISGFSSQRAHLSVYKEFVENSSGNYDARYPSKVASVPLNNGTANVDFNVSDSQGSLLVEIWFYDGSDPIQKVITSGDNTWTM